MKNRSIQYFFIILMAFMLVFSGCTKEKPVDPKQADSFMKFFGGPFNDRVGDMAVLSDQSYLIIGSQGNEEDINDVIIIKTDRYGDQQWKRIIDFGNDETGNSIKVSGDGKIFFTATVKDSTGQSDIMLGEIATDGTLLWSKQYGNSYNQVVNAFIPVNNEFIILTGSTSEPNANTGNPENEQDIFLMKTTFSGDSLWMKVFGGAAQDYPADIIIKDDGGFILTGATSSFFEAGQQGSNILVAETNQNGLLVDFRTLGGASADYGISMKSLTDGYVVLGNSNSGTYGKTDYYLVRLGKNIHTIVWEKYYGTSENDIAGSLMVTNDNGYLICGSTEGDGNGLFDAQLIKTDQDGTEIFNETYGSTGNELGGKCNQTTDLGFIITGTSEVEKNTMIMMIKTDLSGKIGN